MPDDTQSRTIESTAGQQQAVRDAGNAISRAMDGTRAHLTDALGRACEKTNEALHSRRGPNSARSDQGDRLYSRYRANCWPGGRDAFRRTQRRSVASALVVEKCISAALLPRPKTTV